MEVMIRNVDIYLYFKSGDLALNLIMYIVYRHFGLCIFIIHNIYISIDIKDELYTMYIIYYTIYIIHFHLILCLVFLIAAVLLQKGKSLLQVTNVTDSNIEQLIG